MDQSQEQILRECGTETSYAAGFDVLIGKTSEITVQI